MNDAVVENLVSGSLLINSVISLLTFLDLSVPHFFLSVK